VFGLCEGEEGLEGLTVMAHGRCGEMMVSVGNGGWVAGSARVRDERGVRDVDG